MQRENKISAWLLVGYVSLCIHSSNTPAAPVSGFLGTSPAVLSEPSAGNLDWGDNTANNADDTSVYAPFSQIALTNNGDTITLSGQVTLLGMNSLTNRDDQFRWGLYNVNGSANLTNWLGYFASNDTSSNVAGGTFRERINPNSNIFSSLTGANTLVTTTNSVTELLNSTLYKFDLSLTRTVAGLNYFAEFMSSSNSVINSFTGTDTTVSTYTFDRVGFLSGGNLNADQLQLRNVDVSFTPATTSTPVPEPSPVLLLPLGLVLLKTGGRRNTTGQALRTFPLSLSVPKP